MYWHLIFISLIVLFTTIACNNNPSLKTVGNQLNQQNGRSHNQNQEDNDDHHEHKKTLSLTITGMTCEGCKNSIEQALKMKDGIVSAEVSLATATAKIVYDEDKIDVPTIKQTIIDAGFGVTP